MVLDEANFDLIRLFLFAFLRYRTLRDFDSFLCKHGKQTMKTVAVDPKMIKNFIARERFAGQSTTYATRLMWLPLLIYSSPLNFLRFLLVSIDHNDLCDTHKNGHT